MATKKKISTQLSASLPKQPSHKSVLGSIVLARFATQNEEQKLPAAIATPLKSFTAAHSELKVATTAIADATSQKLHAKSAIVAVDAQLNAAIHALANALVGASLGTRQKPFAGISPLAPGKLVHIGYARKVKAVRAIVKKLAPKKVPPAVTSALKGLGARADAVAKALGAVTAPGVAVTAAQKSLAGVVVAWDSAFSRLRTLATSAWIDDVTKLATVYAKPDTLQTPKPSKKKAATRVTKKAAAAAKKAATAAKRAAKAAAKVTAVAAKKAAKKAAKTKTPQATDAKTTP